MATFRCWDLSSPSSSFAALSCRLERLSCRGTRGAEASHTRARTGGWGGGGEAPTSRGRQKMCTTTTTRALLPHLLSQLSDLPRQRACIFGAAPANAGCVGSQLSQLLLQQRHLALANRPEKKTPHEGRGGMLPRVNIITTTRPSPLSPSTWGRSENDTHTHTHL
jgi:hypothetical protein